MAARLPNYIKALRRRSGLTQADVAFLLGNKGGAQLSRYEKHHRVPPLHIALALGLIFGTPSSEVFAGLHDVVGTEVATRMKALAVQIRNQSANTASLRRAQWLEARRTAVAEETRREA